MRLEGYVLSALMVAASAAIFGDLGRAAAPDEAEMQTPLEASTASLSPPAELAAADPCAPRATALRFLDQGAYASDATSGCALR